MNDDWSETVVHLITKTLQQITRGRKRYNNDIVHEHEHVCRRTSVADCV